MGSLRWGFLVLRKEAASCSPLVLGSRGATAPFTLEGAGLAGGHVVSGAFGPFVSATQIAPSF